MQRKIEERMSRRSDDNFILELVCDVLEDVGPSMLMSSTCQTVRD